YAGKEVSSAQFQAHLEKTTGQSLNAYFDYWLQQPGLPTIRLGKVEVTPDGNSYKVEGEILRESQAPRTSLDVVLTTEKGEETKTIVLESPQTSFTFAAMSRPQHLVVDKYGDTAKRDGGVFSVLSFYADPEHTLIVYGTADESAANREAAE